MGKLLQSWQRENRVQALEPFKQDNDEWFETWFPPETFASEEEINCIIISKRRKSKKRIPREK